MLPLQSAARCCSLLLLLAISPGAKVTAQTSDNLIVSVLSTSSSYFIGTELTILATSNHPDLQIVGWMHESTAEWIASSEAYTISTASDGSNSRLKITSPVASDAGVYTVVAQNTQGQEIRKDSQDIVLLYPAIVNANPLQYILDGSLGILNCSTPNVSTMHWMFKGQPIASSAFNFTELSDGRLQISTMSEQYEGMYTCEVFVAQYFMQWSKAIVLERAAPVTITNPPTGVDVLEGERVELVIGYHGNPKPNVTWYRDGAELVAPATQDSGPVALVGTHSLALGDILEGQEGVYRAELVNLFGSDTVSVSVNVSVSAEITLLPNAFVLSGTPVIMTCEARGTPPLRFSWRFNGAAWAGNVTDTATQSAITVGVARTSIVGTYQCIVWNAFGTNSSDAILAIIKEPATPAGIVSASPTTTSLTVQWNCLASPSQPVERFNIAVRSDATGEVRRFVHMLDSVQYSLVSTRYEVGDLVPGTMYFVGISAVNEAGEGNSSEEADFLTSAAPPALSSVSAVGYNYTAIEVTVTLEYRGSSQPIGFLVSYTKGVAGVTTKGTRTFSNVQLDGLTWSGVVSGLTEFDLYVFTVTPMSSVGQGRSLVTPPTNPEAVPSAAPSLALLSAAENSLQISASLTDLGLPAVTAVELNVTSPIVLTQRVDINGTTLPATVTFTLSGLHLFTVYRVQVYGVGAGGLGQITQGEFTTALGPVAIAVICTTGAIVLLCLLLIIISTACGVYRCWKNRPKSHFFHQQNSTALSTVVEEVPPLAKATETRRLAESPGRLRRGDVGPMDPPPRSFPHAQSFTGQPWEDRTRYSADEPLSSSSDTALLVGGGTNTTTMFYPSSQPKLSMNTSPVPSDRSRHSTGHCSSTGGTGSHLDYKSVGDGSIAGMPRRGSGNTLSSGGGGQHVSVSHLGMGDNHQRSSSHLGVGGSHQGSGSYLGVGGSHQGSGSYLGVGGSHQGSGSYLGVGGSHQGSSSYLGMGVGHHVSGSHLGTRGSHLGMGGNHVDRGGGNPTAGSHLGPGSGPRVSSGHIGMGGGHQGSGSHLGVGTSRYGVGSTSGSSAGVSGSRRGPGMVQLPLKGGGWTYSHNNDAGLETPESVRAIPVVNCSTVV